MKRFLERQVVFNATLRLLAFLGQRRFFNPLTRWLTVSVAQLNLFLNNPSRAASVDDLARTWKRLMPPDGQDYFKIAAVDENTATAEIHLHCPLRGTGNVDACYRLMNYDRELMKQVGGQLIVLESQSKSGKALCKLAIRKIGEDTSDLIPAHKR
ncbi:MAG: hypothetical protein AAGA85_12875 [Bacteroidota bacterium]